MKNMRNFWIELEVDGRKTKVACGPASKTGGFFLKVLMRADGESAEALTLQGMASPDGELLLQIRPGKDAPGPGAAVNHGEINMEDKYTFTSRR